ncbi:ABC transporter ATP-binding protein [Thermoflavimicrobium dichotomicum]|uniref:Iron complex transport system ATP-binding protein n=1 Tax=Thermoflavimicrobium dichotomicum TaxID=46223 RepID=A0A1I3KBZ6_9BACL|nr:ABC transporter ATP-binding protein [Thermoflavimicrobium dichotomicum]SFI70029.1 iron complex transport system ATP-binding protein [Thermoflavimicrobium dichotomicum]
MTTLSAEQLTIGYDERTIVRQLDLVFPPGQITAIIGPNGCGKSTILKTMARLHPATSGAVYLDGKMIQKMPTKEIAKKMAILPQSPEAPNGLTVYELVSYGRTPHQSGFVRLNQHDCDMIAWALEVTGLTELQHQAVDALSGGQRQRAWIAMALAQETDLLLLDEPTTYLDLAHQLEVLQLLEKLNQEDGRTIIMVIHDLNHASRFAHQLVALKKGSIVKQGTAEQVMIPNVLKEVFNIDTTIVRDPRTNKPAIISYDLIR